MSPNATVQAVAAQPVPTAPQPAAENAAGPSEDVPDDGEAAAEAACAVTEAAEDMAEAAEEDAEAHPPPRARRRSSVTRFAAQFHSQALLTEAICEYSAIWAVHLLPPLFHDRLLHTPLPYFNTDPPPFPQPLEFLPLAYSALLQTAMEVLVDALSFALLSLWGRPRQFQTAWAALPKWGLCGALVMGAWLGAAVMRAALDPEHLTACLERDLCYCANGRGLAVGGLRQRYCEYVYPANARAVPGTPPGAGWPGHPS